MLDLLLKNGILLSGDGSPRMEGGVAMADGRIVDAGPRVSGQARRVIDADGAVIAPGFIDLHTHAVPCSNHNFLRQGVTLAVTGNCGLSSLTAVEYAAMTVADCAARLRADGAGVNLAMLSPHNTVRTAVLGMEDRAPRADELSRMEELVTRDMEAGAMGFSTGLAYAPGCYAELDELVALARAVARFGGYYASHIRNEGPEIDKALDEALTVGRESGLPVHISHHKVVGQANWGRSRETLARLDRARAEGVDVTQDQYPYTASSSTLQLLLPLWALAGGPEALRARLRDPEKRARIEAFTRERLAAYYGSNLANVQIGACPPAPSLAGKSLDAILAMHGLTGGVPQGAALVAELIEQFPDRDAISCVFHSMCEQDVETVMASPFTAVGSDAWDVDFDDGCPHPRLYGTFPRVLGRYCRERGVLSLEEAVRRMTGLPAQRLGLRDRGTLQAGAWADLVVFDPDTVIDQALFNAPHRYPVGITHVFVNGAHVVENGLCNGARAGAFVRRP